MCLVKETGRPSTGTCHSHQALLIARDYTISVEHIKDTLARNRRTATNRNQSHSAYVSDLLDRVERGEVTNAFSKMLEDLEPELYS